jgi:hypothetical protein
MAAPTKPAKREESSCQSGAVHTWHETDITGLVGDVRSGVERQWDFVADRSESDPRATLGSVLIREILVTEQY